MTLYLWHIPALVAAILICHAAGLDAYDPAQPFFWPLLMLCAAVFTVAMSVLFVALTPAEHRALPWWDAAIIAMGPLDGHGHPRLHRRSRSCFDGQAGLGTTTGGGHWPASSSPWGAARALSAAKASSSDSLEMHGGPDDP